MANEGSRVRALGGLAVRAVYGIYAWLALFAIIVPTSVLLALAPRLDQRRRIARGGSPRWLAAHGERWTNILKPLFRYEVRCSRPGQHHACDRGRIKTSL